MSSIEIRNMWTVFFSVFIFMLLWWDCDNILCISFYSSLSFKRWLQRHRAAAVSFVLILNQLLLTFLHLSLLSMLFYIRMGFPLLVGSYSPRLLYSQFPCHSLLTRAVMSMGWDKDGELLPHHCPRLHLILSSHIFHLGNWGISIFIFIYFSFRQRWRVIHHILLINLFLF